MSKICNPKLDWAIGNKKFSEKNQCLLCHDNSDIVK